MEEIIQNASRARNFCFMTNFDMKVRKLHILDQNIQYWIISCVFLIVNQYKKNSKSVSLIHNVDLGEGHNFQLEGFRRIIGITTFKTKIFEGFASLATFILKVFEGFLEIPIFLTMFL